MEQRPDIMWGQCLEIIRDNLTPQQFKNSFAFVELHTCKFENGTYKLVLNVPSEFIRDILEKNYLQLMRSTFTRVYGPKIQLFYNVTVDNSTPGGVIREKSEVVNPIVQNGRPREDARKTPGPVTAPAVQDLDSQLKLTYNFDNYIEGDSNRLARSVGEAIAKKPASTFNPFFVFGPSGCGKTHLVNAIGLRIKELHPEMRVLYISAHLFMVQYTDAVRQNKVNDFILFYQTIDTLIIDDIQELSGKTQTQNTFFHIFNHLQVNNKQIILTADRPPIAIKGLEDRLLTRFKWGLQAEIEKPTQTLRLSILNAKVQKEGLSIPVNVIKYISENVDESVRDLEGIINSLMAYSVVYNCDINMKLVEKVLPRFVDVNTVPITFDLVKETVGAHFGIKVEEIDSKVRKQNIVYARQIAMYLADQLTDLSYSQIGLQTGSRNHATVTHAIKQVRDLIEVDNDTRQAVDDIKLELRTAR